MTTTGLDYSAGVITPASAILTAGYSFAIRYVDDPTVGLSSKHIVPAEYTALTAAGVDVYLVFEVDTTDITDGPGGNPEGAAHARRALTGAQWIGYPTGRPIFFACDEHLGPALVQTGMAYLDGAHSVLAGTGYTVGAYGFSEFIQAAQTGRHADVFWQCGVNPGPTAGVHLWQRNDLAVLPVVGGVECDVNNLYLPLISPAAAAEDTVDFPITIHPDGSFRGVLNAECGRTSSRYATGYVSWSSSWGATVWTVSCQGDDGRGNTFVLPGQVVNRPQPNNTRGWTQLPDGTVKVTVEGKLVDPAAAPSAMWIPVPK